MRILGKTKKILLDKDFKEIISGEFISVTGGVLAGYFLSRITNHLELIPGLLIVIPALLELHGNILGSLSGRISTRLHLKQLKPKFYKSKILSDNIIASFLLMALVSLIIGLIAFLATSIFFKQVEINILFISFGAGIVSALFTIPLTVKSVFYLFKRKLDPDDIMGPYITTIGDISVIIAVLIVLLVI